MSGLFEDQQGRNNIGNLSDINKMGAYAFFPGTGPVGRACAQCIHFFAVGKTKRVCSKFAHMKGISPHKAPAIRSAPACKYFEKLDAVR